MANESFNSQTVAGKLSNLEGLFQEFATVLNDANTCVNELINNGPDSAIFGTAGAGLLAEWNNNASTFGDFHKNFQHWAEVVTLISQNNASFTARAEGVYAKYRSTGGNLEGISEARTAAQTSLANGTYGQEDNSSTTTTDDKYLNAKVPSDAESKDVSDKYGEGSVMYTWTDSAGNCYKVIKDKDGREIGRIVQTTDDQTLYYDQNGKTINYDQFEENMGKAKDGTLVFDNNKTAADYVVSEDGIPSDIEPTDMSHMYGEGSKRYSWFDEETSTYHTVFTDKDGNIISQIVDTNAKAYNNKHIDLSDATTTYFDSEGKEIDVEQFLALKNAANGETSPSSAPDNGAQDSVDSTTEPTEASGGQQEQDGGAQEKATPVTVSSGQQVNLNGENCYFLAQHRDGTTYYVKSNDPNAQVYVMKDGQLVPYLRYGDEIVSRVDFVDDKTRNMEYNWNVTYNNDSSPYQSVGTSVDQTFTENVTHKDYTSVQYSNDYLKQNATTLDNLDRGAIGLDRANTPEVIYVAPGQEIEYDVPWDNYDNTIDGGAEGTYLVYDQGTDSYFVIENGQYRTSSVDTRGLAISREQLLNERTTISK